MSQVLQHVISAIGPASQAAAAVARDAVRDANTPMLERLAAALAGAQHTSRPRVAQRLVVVAAGDHGCGDPGIAMGADHPTVIAARAIADGSAALCQVARPTPIVLVDAGAREPAHMPEIAIQLGRGPSRDLLREPALTPVDAILGLEAGIALSLSLSEAPAPASAASGTTGHVDVLEPRDIGRRLDVLALGAIGLGAEVASAALLGATTGMPITLEPRDDAADLALHRGIAMRGSSGVDLLAQFGSSDTAVLAGLILGAASMNVPVILDGYATGAAALVAARLAPDVTGYLIAAHRGSFTMPAILEALGLQPVFEVGLGHGEGTGAAMVLPLLDQVAAITARR